MDKEGEKEERGYPDPTWGRKKEKRKTYQHCFRDSTFSHFVQYQLVIDRQTYSHCTYHGSIMPSSTNSVTSSQQFCYRTSGDRRKPKETG